MGATENVGFDAKVQWNIGLDSVTKQHKSLQNLQPPYSLCTIYLLQRFVSDMLTRVTTSLILSLWRTLAMHGGLIRASWGHERKRYNDDTEIS